MYSSSFPKYSMFTSPHRVSHLTFILYSPDLLYKVTYIFWALTCLVALPTHTALISSFCTSSQNFDTHFLHFHLTMDSLCFSMWLAIYTSTTDFHRLAKRHACRTKKRGAKEAPFFSLQLNPPGLRSKFRSRKLHFFCHLLNDNVIGSPDLLYLVVCNKEVLTFLG